MKFCKFPLLLFCLTLFSSLHSMASGHDQRSDFSCRSPREGLQIFGTHKQLEDLEISKILINGEEAQNLDKVAITPSPGEDGPKAFVFEIFKEPKTPELSQYNGSIDLTVTLQKFAFDPSMSNPDDYFTGSYINRSGNHPAARDLGLLPEDQQIFYCRFKPSLYIDNLMGTTDPRIW